MPFIMLSFDDSVKDTYKHAYPVLKKKNLPFTINVISSNIEKCNPDALSVEELLECYRHGAEIACHGHTHKNTASDVTDNILYLKQIGVNVKNIGFASPHSYLTNDNCSDIKELLNRGKLSYIRTGVQIRRSGFIFTVLSYLERKTHSCKLFYNLNKHNIIKDKNSKVLLSVAITKYTTLKQIKYFLSKLKEDEGVIFMFHHIIPFKDNYYHIDTWYFDLCKFEELCDYLCDSRFTVLTTKEFVLSNKNNSKILCKHGASDFEELK